MKKFDLIAFIVLMIVGMSLSACQTSDPETIIKTVVVEKEGETIVETVVVTVEPTEKVEEVDETDSCCDVFKIGIYEEPVSLNYWNYLGPGSSVWTRYVISNDAAHLFTISDHLFQFVPSLAKDIPTPVDNNDGTWSVTVEMVDDAYWSDGQLITAHDVTFTHNVCKDLQLTWYWPSFCTPDGAEIVVKALDDFTVEYTYLDQSPNIRNWQFGIAMAPILPATYWEDVAAQAYEIVQDVQTPTTERPEGCNGSGITIEKEEQCNAWAAFDEAYDLAREILFKAATEGQPVAGGYLLQEWQPGNMIRLTANENYYFKDATFIEYQDGAWKRILPDGQEITLYGPADTEESVRYKDGPYNPEVIFEIFGSQEAAFGALVAGDVDYVLNPIEIPRELKESIDSGIDIHSYTNADYNMFYLAFNMLKYPMSEYEFRQVFDIILDKELIVRDVLGEVILPMYSTMPATNTYWHNPDVPKEYLDLSRAERVELAVITLKDAGWRWGTEPYWDEFLQDVVPGENLIMPNGQPMPELTILGPGPEFDIVRATFNQWISEWARELGMPVQSELTGRNTILDSVFVASNYDMYVFGSSLGNPAYPGFYDEFWHSRNCTFETGGMNTPCFKNDTYDALVDEFNQTADLNRARELVFEMQLILAEQRPYIPLYSEKVVEFSRDQVVFPYDELLGGIEMRDGFPTSTQVLIQE